jgi:hypothetical protein
VAKILVTIIGNIFLAALLVFLPAFIAWRGFKGRIKLPQKMGIEDLIVAYVRFSTPKEVFLTTLASSNVLDAFVAAMFFMLLLVLLLHRALWPMVQRPVYALAARGVVRRRKFFFISGLLLIGAGTVPTPAAALVKKLLKAFEGL